MLFLFIGTRLFNYTAILDEDDDHGISKDIDVALWQDYRTHHYMQPVRDALDFIIVNDDEFERVEIEFFTRLNDLLKFCNSRLNYGHAIAC